MMSPRISGILTLFLMGMIALPAPAQLGIGIGVGSGYGGPGLWGGLGSWGNHGYYGFGATISPGQRLQRRQTLMTSPMPGYLVGKVNFCPDQSRLRRCAVPAELMQQTVVNAIDVSNRQWISTQLTSEGTYQLKLLPGTYAVTLNSPVLDRPLDQRIVVTIPAGKTVERELQASPSKARD